ncbi:MAG: ABC transporter permease [Gammaproteobacteria bacterium]|nr:ABC transporter permease [Gammaproteobacteria bacterium]MDE0367495.1 ABC transporter permease [Gammaproteobacteria bacterium]
MTGTSAATTNQPAWFSSFVTLAWVETRTYLRDPAAVFWTFLYPIILLVVMMALFGSPETRSPSLETDIVSSDGQHAQLTRLLERRASFVDGVTFTYRLIDADEASPRDRVRIEFPEEFAPSPENPQAITIRLETEPDASSGSMISMISAVVADLNVELAGGGASVVLHYAIGSGEDSLPGYSRSIYYVIGLTVLTIVSTALFGFTGPLIALRAEGGLKLFQVMPIRRIAFTLGYSSSRLLILLVFVFLYISLGMRAYGPDHAISPSNWLLLMILVALSSASFLSLGMAIAGVVTKINTANTLINLVNIPIMFLSDLFIPISLMPESIESAARYSPVFMLADSMRQVATGTAGLAECWPTILYLVSLAAIGIIIVATSFRWNIPE